MSTASVVVEEQPPEPTSWQKARRLFSSSKKKSSSGTKVGGGGGSQAASAPYHVEDDDAQSGYRASTSAPAPALQEPTPKSSPPATSAPLQNAAVTKSPSQAGLPGSSPPPATHSNNEAAAAAADPVRRGSASSAPPAEGERDAVVAGDSDGVAEEDDDDDEIVEPASGVIEFLHKGAPYFWLSNHFSLPVYHDNIRYPSAEHLFQSLKFPHRPDIAKAVRKAETASDAVKIARKHSADCRKGWRQEGLNIIAMRHVLLLKFTQHTALRARLLQTGSADLVYASPTDVFWGAGRGIDSQRPAIGRNELGKALVKTRDLLLTSAGLGWGSAAKTV
ncbi:unnamed protein product [Parajaminaea phylloscopi]